MVKMTLSNAHCHTVFGHEKDKPSDRIPYMSAFVCANNIVFDNKYFFL